MAERAGAARRRRGRRQRSWWRHEALSVAAALATARHHSAGPGVVTRGEGQQEEVEVKQHDGLRAQTTPPPGTRPGVPLDPGPPVVGAVTVGYVAAPGPLLAPPVLAGGDGLDESALAFLVQQTLLARDKEEAEAVEAAKLAELEAKLARAEERIVEEIDRLKGLKDRPAPQSLLRVVLSPGRGEEENGEEEEEEEEEVATEAAVLVVRIFYGPLYLAVTCSVLCGFSSGRRLLDLLLCTAHCLVRPLIHVMRQFTEWIMVLTSILDSQVCLTVTCSLRCLRST